MNGKMSGGVWLALVLLAPGVAWSGAINPGDLTLQVRAEDSSSSYSFSYDRGALGCGSGEAFSCSNSGIDTAQDPYKNYRWELKSWSINAEIDPFVSTSISVTNLFPVTQNFQIITTLPIAPPITPSSLMGGSLQGGISANSDGGTLSVPNASAYYFGQIDFTNVGPPAVLHPDGSPGADVTVGPFLSSSFPSVAFGQPIPSAPGPQALASIGIRLHFDLTPGDTATLSGVFVVEPVPEPGTALLLGAALGGLALLRRRRVRD